MKKLFYFIPLNLEACLQKGNINYLRCYETFFFRSYIVYFNSETTIIKKTGRTIYIGVGFSRYTYINVFLSPIVLFNLYRKIKPDISITTDWLYSFWSSLFIPFYKKYFFYPVNFIGDILNNPKPNDMHSKFLENLSIKLSLLFAPRICVVPSQTDHDLFWETNSLTKDKLLRVSRTVEEYPSLGFIQNILLKMYNY